MQDNYESHIHVRAEIPWAVPTNTSCTRRFDQSDPCFVEWQTNGTGPYSLFGGTLFSTYRSSVSWDNDTDLLFLSVAGFGDFGFYPGFSRRSPAPNSWSSSLVKMQTANPSGTVKLRSKDPREAPHINFNYFVDRADADLQALADGVNMMLRVYDDVGLNYTVVAPNPKIDLKQAIMDDCVDSKFRVNGVGNLRVVDASVFPRVPGAMPNGPTFTISHKAFETIMEGV
jgi:choline dehydrogenase